MLLLLNFIFFLQGISNCHGIKTSIFSRRNILKSTVAGIPLLVKSTVEAADAKLQTQAPAPGFKLPSNRGIDISLSDLTGKGKWTVLYFYPGDFTEGCTIEAKGFQANIEKFSDLNAQIVGISVDTVEKHLDFGKTYGLSFPLLSDAGGVVSTAYGSVLSIPFLGKFSNRQTYIIDQTGITRFIFYDVESRVKMHASDVLSKLTELNQA